MFNEMDQENYGYLASQIIWGQGMNLPADLLYTEGDSGKEDRSNYVNKSGEGITRGKEEGYTPLIKQHVNRRQIPSKREI